MGYIDPTTVRLSDSLLLSDMMGCHSVYANGLANKFMDDADKIRKGRALAETLEDLQEVYGPFHVCYGYISPELSRKIVKYQDPNKPSHHRWDLGAAADVQFTQWTGPPAHLACEIDQEVTDYSRMITYSESPWICLAVNPDEKTPKRSFYENRYEQPGSKPRRIVYSTNPGARAVTVDRTLATPLENWRGSGRPTYHLRGEPQYDHADPNSTAISTFLYNKTKVHKGAHNRPPTGNTNKYIRFIHNINAAGIVLAALEGVLGRRISVIRAYVHDSEDDDWTRRFSMHLVPPVGTDIPSISTEAYRLPSVSRVSTYATPVGTALHITGYNANVLYK